MSDALIGTICIMQTTTALLGTGQHGAMTYCIGKWWMTVSDSVDIMDTSMADMVL